jgi:hypothetical protein
MVAGRHDHVPAGNWGIGSTGNTGLRDEEFLETPEAAWWFGQPVEPLPRRDHRIPIERTDPIDGIRDRGAGFAAAHFG